MDNSKLTPKPTRLLDIDVGKGIAIALVVLGHLVARDIKPEGNDWFLVFIRHLYVFHMSFFFYLAGYVFWTSSADRYGYRFRQAVSRMLPAYLLLAVIAFAAKWGLASLMPMDRPVRSFWNDWLTFFAYPTEGFITFLWFIVALLGIYALTIAAHRMARGNMLVILVCALVLHLLSVNGYVTRLFALHQIARYWLIFVVAYFALQHRDSLNRWLIATWPAFAVMLVASLIWLPSTWRLTLSALISLPALHGASAFVAQNRPLLARRLAWLGAASWPIYLFNGFAIGGAKVLILKSFGWNGAAFFVALPILFVCGLALPIVVQRTLLARVRWLDRITR